MPGNEARIIIEASPVAADRRHTYLLFERSDGRQTVIRGGPDVSTAGDDVTNAAHFLESTLFGADKFGHIRIDSAPYIHPYDAVYQKQADGSINPLPADQANPNDPSLLRNAQGEVIIRREVVPDWPSSGEQDEHTVLWTGTDEALEEKLDSALKAGQQINDAQLEYSPLYNNSNGVTSILLKSADVQPVLPLGKDGKPVSAPDFGENLYQNVGLASNRSGYWFDGKQWYDESNQKIQPPHSGKPTIPLDPDEKSRTGSFNSSFNSQPSNTRQEKQSFGTGDPDLDRLAAALNGGGDAPISRAVAQIEQLPQVQAMQQQGRDALAAQQAEEQRQQQVSQQTQGGGGMRR